MEKCPKCGGMFFAATNKRIGTGYPVKVISCSNCFSVVGTTVSDEVQEMIETVFNRLKSMR